MGDAISLVILFLPLASENNMPSIAARQVPRRQFLADTRMGFPGPKRLEIDYGKPIREIIA